MYKSFTPSTPTTSTMKRSYLLNRQISLKDIVNPNQKTTIEKSAIFHKKQNCQEILTPPRVLFKGLKYKKIDSLETADCQQPDPKQSDKNLTSDDPVTKQKLRQQYNKLKKSMSAQALTKAMQYQNQENDKNQMKTLKVMKKQDEIKKFYKIRKLSQTISLKI